MSTEQQKGAASAKPSSDKAAEGPTVKQKSPQEIEEAAIKQTEAELRALVNKKYGDQQITAQFGDLWDIRPGLRGIIITALKPNRMIAEFALNYEDIDEKRLQALLKYRDTKIAKHTGRAAAAQS